jgi:hypothetical protein
MDYTIVDRRGTSGDKNSSNRQRFLKKVKDQLKRKVQEGFSKRSITSDDSENITITTGGIGEPTFNNDTQTGQTDRVLPGNKNYIPGDLIEKPQRGEGGEPKASDSGEGDDEFTFTISKDEFYDILFEDMELPNLVKTSDQDITEYKMQRAGFTCNGTPASLDLVRTMKNSLGRRIALKSPSDKEIAALLAKIEELENKKGNEEEIKLIVEQIEKLRHKLNYISFIDPIDLRYKNFDKVPKPVSKAVMFCVMDVSGSMEEYHKMIAKKFFTLLYWFLHKKYEKVELVFIRHHADARECTEEQFFYDKETGGTIVSSAFAVAEKIQKERYPASDYNIYYAQATDGDNYESDNRHVEKILTDEILPTCQYFAYIEIAKAPRSRTGKAVGNLWQLYTKLASICKHLQVREIGSEQEIYAVFKNLFEKKREKYGV